MISSFIANTSSATLLLLPLPCPQLYLNSQCRTFHLPLQTYVEFTHDGLSCQRGERFTYHGDQNGGIYY